MLRLRVEVLDSVYPRFPRHSHIRPDTWPPLPSIFLTSHLTSFTTSQSPWSRLSSSRTSTSPCQALGECCLQPVVSMENTLRPSRAHGVGSSVMSPCNSSPMLWASRRRAQPLRGLSIPRGPRRHRCSLSTPYPIPISSPPPPTLGLHFPPPPLHSASTPPLLPAPFHRHHPSKQTC